jgi:thiamine kinase-like enzyme
LGDYDDSQLRMAAALLRQFHDSTTTMPLVRRSKFEVACHNDWAPTNAVFSSGEPTSMIDFDTASPGERLWDLGYSAFTWLDLGNDDLAAEEQIRRLCVFSEGYGHADCTPSRIAVYAVARQTALAASARKRGKSEVADWASQCAAWTALNLIERLLPTGYSHKEHDGSRMAASALQEPKADRP